MKLLKWAETIKQPAPVSKEDILSKVEKAEIICLIIAVFYIVMILFGVITILVGGKSVGVVGSALATIIVASTGYLDNAIKGRLKLERYKTIWDKLDLQQSELRKMQAKDL